MGTCQATQSQSLQVRQDQQDVKDHFASNLIAGLSQRLLDNFFTFFGIFLPGLFLGLATLSRDQEYVQILSNLAM